MNNKLIITLFLALSLVGCALFHSTPRVIGKSSIAEDKAMAKITLQDTSLANVNVERLNKVGVFSEGVNYSLSKETNPSVNVIIADNLNKRITSLANQPSLKEAQEINLIVDELITNNSEGKILLKQKDNEIEFLTQSIKSIQKEREIALKNYEKLADKTASEEDSLQSSIDKMNQWGGIGAIIYGVKRLIIRMAWVLGIGSVLFLLLRILSFSNPLAASVFSIFSKFGSFIISTTEYIFPKAIQEAELVGKEAYEDVATVLSEVLSGIQTAEATSKASGNQVNVSSVISSISTSLTPAQQAVLKTNAPSAAQQAVLNNIPAAQSTPSVVITQPVIISSVVTGSITPITGSKS